MMTKELEQPSTLGQIKAVESSRGTRRCAHRPAEANLDARRHFFQPVEKGLELAPSPDKERTAVPVLDDLHAPPKQHGRT